MTIRGPPEELRPSSTVDDLLTRLVDRGSALRPGQLFERGRAAVLGAVGGLATLWGVGARAMTWRWLRARQPPWQ